MNPSRRAPASGYTLVEMLIAITLGTLIVGMATAVLVKLLDAGTGGHQHAQRLASLARLSEQLTADAAAAHQAQLSGEPASELSLVGDDARQVVYELDGATIERKVLAGDTVQARETFELPGWHAERFEKLETATTTVVRLTIQRTENAAPETAPLVLEAMLDRDRQISDLPASAVLQDAAPNDAADQPRETRGTFVPLLPPIARRRRPQNRRGVVLFIVIAMLTIAMALIVSWVRIIMIERQQLKLVERRQQADWLVESGLRRARARLAVDGNYPGETWHVEPTQLAGEALAKNRTYGADVMIEVHPDTVRSSHRAVRVQVSYPPSGEDRVQRSKQLSLQTLAPEGPT